MPSTEQLLIELPIGWLRPEGVSQNYPISETMLARLRFKRKGPPFTRLGHKTILYRRQDIEAWLLHQPAGGDTRLRTANAAKDGGATKRSKIPA
jgi:hypothetical protein